MAFLAVLFSVCFVACQDDETEIGYGLQDRSTYYNGTRDTIYFTASTFFEDSLQTSGAPSPYSAGILGNYSDATFGSMSADFYTQLCPVGEGGVNLDPTTTHIDSVVLGMMVHSWYPNTADSSRTYNLHFEVMQLAEMLQTDSNYYASNTIPVGSECYFNGTKQYSERDTMIHLKLGENINPLFMVSLSSEEFIANAKGLRIRLLGDSDPCAPVINLAAVSTKLCVYYTYNGLHDSVDFLCGTGTNHFSHIEHNYSGTVFNAFVANPKDSIPGTQYLYLDPLGGTKIKFNLNEFIAAFKLAHPYAIIHHAELLLPKADIADDLPPERILAYKTSLAGFEAPIPDLLNEYYGDYSGGFDGRFHADKNYYRLRITRHLQQLLRTGFDLGTTLYIDARRSSANRTVINGSEKENPIRIEFVYSESNYQQ